MNSSDLMQQYIGNTTAPPENFRFIPGWTPMMKNSNSTNGSLANGNITGSVPRSGRTPVFNGTGYYIDDEVEPGLNDLQTLLLACFATLAPLIITLLTAFGIRFLWKKFAKRQERCTEFDGALHADDGAEAVQRPLHSHLYNSDKMKSNETTHISIGTEDVELCDETGTLNSGSLRGNHSSTNGSIITMTMKNNHLIVETEERNDIEEDSRETTMKYSPSARDGVFVVEVQQGMRRSPSATEPTKETETSVSNQCALVHNPPERYSDDDVLEESDENYYVETSSLGRDTPDSWAHRIRTGMAQSNASLTSTCPDYCYGNQQGYEAGTHGYPLYFGYASDEPPTQRLSVDVPVNSSSKPKITSAVYKNRAYSKGGSIDVPIDGHLFSDMYVTEPPIREEDRIVVDAKLVNANRESEKSVGGCLRLGENVKEDKS